MSGHSRCNAAAGQRYTIAYSGRLEALTCETAFARATAAEFEQAAQESIDDFTGKCGRFASIADGVDAEHFSRDMCHPDGQCTLCASNRRQCGGRNPVAPPTMQTWHVHASARGAHGGR